MCEKIILAINNHIIAFYQVILDQNMYFIMYIFISDHYKLDNIVLDPFIWPENLSYVQYGVWKLGFGWDFHKTAVGHVLIDIYCYRMTIQSILYFII